MLVNDKTAFLFPESEDKPIKVVFPDCHSCPLDSSILCEHSQMFSEASDICFACSQKERNEENCIVARKGYVLFE